MSSHKEYAGQAALKSLAERYIRRYGLKADFNPEETGGVIFAQDGTPLRQVRAPFWRAEKGAKGTGRKDMPRVYTATNPDPDKPNSGLELEFQAFHAMTGEMEPVMDADHPVHQGLLEHNRKAKNGHTENNGNGLGNGNGVNGYVFVEDGADWDHDFPTGPKEVGFSPELTRHTLEENFPPNVDSGTRNRETLYGISTVVQLAEANNTLISPFSTIPHRDITQIDTNQHPYVQRIAFEHMGPEKVKHFTGTSLQIHVEIKDLESALHAANRWQLVTPIMYAGTLSAPFIAGEITPDLQERYGQVPDVVGDPLKESTFDTMTQGPHESYRYYGRLIGSPSGGAMRQPLPETSEEFWSAANNLLKSGESPSVGRVAGHHADFRIRPDLGPYGTIELAVLDTAGARIPNIVAIQEFSRALGWKLQRQAGNWEQIMEDPRFKSIFGQAPSKETFETVHWNTIEVAKHGNKAMITGMDGEQHSIAELWSKLVEYVQEPIEETGYTGLPEGIIEVLDKAYQDPSELFDVYKDEKGVTSVKGFYETGVGTMSQWARQRAEELKARGLAEKEAIIDTTLNVGKSFHEHVKSMTPKDLNTLYVSANKDVDKSPQYSANGQNPSYQTTAS